jgi:hypothetical protein
MITDTLKESKTAEEFGKLLGAEEFAYLRGKFFEGADHLDVTVENIKKFFDLAKFYDEDVHSFKTSKGIEYSDYDWGMLLKLRQDTQTINPVKDLELWFGGWYVIVYLVIDDDKNEISLRYEFAPNGDILYEDLDDLSDLNDSDIEECVKNGAISEKVRYEGIHAFLDKLSWGFLNSSVAENFEELLLEADLKRLKKEMFGEEENPAATVENIKRFYQVAEENGKKVYSGYISEYTEELPFDAYDWKTIIKLKEETGLDAIEELSPCFDTTFGIVHINDICNRKITLKYLYDSNHDALKKLSYRADITESDIRKCVKNGALSEKIENAYLKSYETSVASATANNGEDSEEEDNESEEQEYEGEEDENFNYELIFKREEQYVNTIIEDIRKNNFSWEVLQYVNDNLYANVEIGHTCFSEWTKEKYEEYKEPTGDANVDSEVEIRIDYCSIYRYINIIYDRKYDWNNDDDLNEMKWRFYDDYEDYAGREDEYVLAYTPFKTDT